MTSAEMLARFKLLGRIPSVTQYPTDEQIYMLLSDAHDEVFRLVCAHAPQVNMGAPVQLTTSDGGYTYTFPGGIFPIGHVEVAARDGGRVLYGGTYFEGTLDFVAEGDRIRIPNGRSRAFASGPYARFCTPPAGLSASVEPTLKPALAHSLVVYRALEKFANIGGLKDPSPYREEFERIWLGDPSRGDGGLLYTLKSQFDTGNAAANPKYYASWWDWVDAVNATASNGL